MALYTTFDSSSANRPDCLLTLLERQKVELKKKEM